MKSTVLLDSSFNGGIRAAPVQQNASHAVRIGTLFVAYIILIHVKRLPSDLRAFFGESPLSFGVGPILVAHIILIHVKRFTNDLRADLVALLGNVRAIVSLSLIAM